MRGLKSGTGIWYREVLQMTAPQSSTSIIYAPVTELTTSTLANGLYRFVFHGVAQSTSTTRGIGVRINQGLTGTVTYLFARWGLPNTGLLGATDKYFWYDQTSIIDNICGTSVPLLNSDCLVFGEGFFLVSSPTAMRIELRVEAIGIAGSLRFPSTLIIEKLE